jgi:elongation factor 1 alpha-like protein
MQSDYDYDDDASYRGFDEDALNDDDYDLLHDMLPAFKDRVLNAKFNDVSDDLLKEYIWEAHFDPDEAFEIVKENHKRMYIIYYYQFILSSIQSNSIQF